MARAAGKYVVLGIVVLLGVLVVPPWSWGQTTERLGTVLAVEGVAEVRTAQATEWERLRFRDGIFLNDTVRTAAEAKLKVLLQDDSIMTLAEQSEMQFTDFLLTEQQRRSIVNLFVGKVRLLTTRLFGTGSFTEVHTPNAVAGVRGSGSVIQYAPQTAQTTHLCESGDCYMSNPTQPSQFLTVPPGHIAQQTGAPGLPTVTRQATQTEQQTLGEGTQVTEQDPQETQTTEEQAQLPAQTEPPRGETISTAPTGPSPSTVVTTALPTQPTTVPLTPERRAEAIVFPTTIDPTSPRVVNNPQNTTISDPSVSPPAQEFIQSRLQLIVNFPRAR
jgi:hypothetical protein